MVIILFYPSKDVVDLHHMPFCFTETMELNDNHPGRLSEKDLTLGAISGKKTSVRYNIRL